MSSSTRRRTLEVGVFVEETKVGRVVLTPITTFELINACQESFQKASKSIPTKLSVVYAVENSFLEPSYRGEGIGTEMYVHAVHAVASHDAVVVPGNCVEHWGHTSTEALRVWEGTQFQSAVQVFDDRIAWGG